MTNPMAVIGYKDNAELRYARQGNLIRVKIQNLVNHEIRDVIVGLFFRLSREDRQDLLREIATYNDEDTNVYLGVVASAICEETMDGKLHFYEVEKITNTDRPGRRP